MTDWIRTLLDCRLRGQPAMLITVASVRGSAPREAGARMVVTAQRQLGTIGGGNLELQAASIARDLLASSGPGGAGSVRRFPLGASLGQCCGGAVELMFEPVSPLPAETGWLDAAASAAAADRPCVIVAVAGRASASCVVVVSDGVLAGSLGSADRDAQALALAETALGGDGGVRLAAVTGTPEVWLVDPIRPPPATVVLFGAGHVGQALVRLLGECPFRVVWVDPRADQFPATVPPSVRIAVEDDPVIEVDAAPPGSCFLVMTHSHALDEALARRILLRPDVAWFGMIGSVTKRRRFEQRLAAQGVSAARLAAMACPIGLPGIPGKSPGVVAVSVAAQLLQVVASLPACRLPGFVPGRRRVGQRGDDGGLR